MPTPILAILDLMESLSRYISNASGLISKFILNQWKSSKQGSAIAEIELRPLAL
jgi:hypothetical protein